jgi:O-antigen/teichoic acid export membrane protein
VIWALIQQVGGQAGSYVVFVVLAALLRPEDFGVLGMATVWTGFLNAFAEVGFGAALVQRLEIRSEHLSTTFAINIAAGLVLALTGLLLSPVAGAFFGTPQVAPVMAALSAGFLLRSLSLTQAAYAQRHLRFRVLALRDVGASLAGGVAGVAGAMLGWGVWSLVAMTLVNQAAASALIWWNTDWRPKWGEISRACASELWPYSSQIFGFSVLKAVVQNSDRLVIGYLLGPASLGLYTFAWRIIVFPVRLVSSAFGTYLFPKAARLQSQVPAVRRQYVQMMAVLLSIVLPATSAAVLLAPALVPPLFGPRWSAAVVPIQILSLTALTGAFFPVVGELAKALGRPGWMIGWSALYTVVQCSALGIGAQYGLQGAVLASAIGHVALLPAIFVMADRVVGLRWRDVLSQWLPSVVASAVFAGVIGLCLQLGVVPSFIRAWLALAMGMVVYAWVLAYLDPQVSRMLGRRVQPTRLASVEGGEE